MDSKALALAATAVIGSIGWYVMRVRGTKQLDLRTLSHEMKRYPKLSSRLVAHRGWHYPNDDTRRPLENTLAAYERAWTAGLPFCECDVTLTKDKEIVLCHDNDLKRLALNAAGVVKPVSDCNFRGELEFFPLKDGSRVPTLREVLHAAKRAGSDKKLVIEIKGQDEECAKQVSQLIEKENLENQVALVMSFSVESMRAFAKCNAFRGKILSMLLTVRRKGSKNFYFDLSETDNALQILKDNQLDGLYLQFDKSYLGDERFVELCKRVPVGVWGRYFFDPDDVKTAETLVSRGALFVNTDLPDSFFGSTQKVLPADETN